MQSFTIVECGSSFHHPLRATLLLKRCQWLVLTAAEYFDWFAVGSTKVGAQAPCKTMTFRMPRSNKQARGSGTNFPAQLQLRERNHRRDSVASVLRESGIHGATDARTLPRGLSTNNSSRDSHQSNNDHRSHRHMLTSPGLETDPSISRSEAQKLPPTDRGEWAATLRCRFLQHADSR